MQKIRSTFPLWEYWYMGSVTFVVIYLWKKSMSKKVLYLLSLLNLFSAVLLGSILSFIVSKDLMIGILCGAVIMDGLSFTAYGGSDWWVTILLILAGQLLNVLFISMFIHKNWYRGFPATLFPGVLFICFFFCVR
jgi:hypothetical protein